MKDSGTMTGGTLKSSVVANCESPLRLYCHHAHIITRGSDATYLLKSLQGFKNNGIKVYAISIQNEPLNTNPTYPTSKLTPSTEGQIGKSLRTLMDSNGFSSVKLIGGEICPVQLVASQH
jgi:hypothetical protein